MKIWRKNRNQYAQLFSIDGRTKLVFLNGNFSDTFYFEDLKGNCMESVNAKRIEKFFYKDEYPKVEVEDKSVKWSVGGIKEKTWNK